jgi:hypothetical protein
MDTEASRGAEKEYRATCGFPVGVTDPCARTVKVAGALVPPPGAGLLTTRLNAAGWATMSADRLAVSSVLLTTVAGKADPFTLSVD